MLDLFGEFFKEVFEQESSQPLAFVIALTITFLITPIIQERSKSLNLSRSEDRDSHLKTSDSDKPRLGGIAIFLAISITIGIYLAVYGRYTPSGIQHLELEGMMVGASIIFILGLLDDIKALNPFVKLTGQIFAASAAWLMSVRIEFLANPFHYIQASQSATIQLDELSSYLVTVIFLVLISNAVNLIDGIDGLAVGLSLIASLASWAITMSPLLYQPAGAVLAATMAGACFGFLRYNFNPARIFLGDNGAYLLGFLLGCISCIGLVKKVTVVVMSPILILIFLVPLCDTCFAILRRAFGKKEIMKADLDHVHYKLLDMGLNQKQVSFLLYGITFLSALGGSFMLGQEIAFEFMKFSLVIAILWGFFSLVINIKHQKKC